MKSTLQQYLIVAVCCIGFSLTDDYWSVDDDTLPESLPALMRNQSECYTDEEIAKAVFSAYKVQNDVVSEHNGHMFDPVTPPNHFDDRLTLPNARASSLKSDVVFENNTVTGLAGGTTCMSIGWSTDKVSTKVTWKELQISGKYTHLDKTHFTKGEYRIFVEDILYQANTPLSKNSEMYYLSEPPAAVTYSKFRTEFTGDYSFLDELSASRYLLDGVVLRRVADFAAASARQNVSSAVRTAVRPYVIYKNQSDPHFPGVAGQLVDGRRFAVSDPFADGLDHAVQKVTAVQLTSSDNGTSAIVYADYALHNVSGTFRLRVDDAEFGTVYFAVERFGLSVEYDALRPNCFCSIDVQAYGPTAVGPGDNRPDTGAMYRQVAKAFADSVGHHLSVGTCSAIVKMNKFGRENPSCDSSPPQTPRSRERSSETPGRRARLD